MIRLTEQIYGFGNDLMIGSCGFCYSVIPVYHYKGGKKGPQQKRTANSRSSLFHSLLVLGEGDHLQSQTIGGIQGTLLKIDIYDTIILISA